MIIPRCPVPPCQNWCRSKVVVHFIPNKGFLSIEAEAYSSYYGVIPAEETWQLLLFPSRRPWFFLQRNYWYWCTAGLRITMICNNEETI